MTVNPTGAARGPRASGAVTLRDIAAEAGVSLMTVSNVVNGNTARVSAGTLERVQALLDRRGYVASATARSLVARSSRLVGLLLPNAEDDVLSLNPHSVQVFGYLERELRGRGYHLLFRGVNAPDEVALAMRTWKLDGVVILGFRDDEVDGLAAAGPIVALDSYSINASTTGVRSDDYEGGRLAARHLADLGHHRIAFIGPALDGAGVVQQRFDGFRAGLAEAGIDWDPRDRVEVAPTWDLGVEVGRGLADRAPDVTAVFATADILAAGIMDGLSATGLRVPGDVSVVGFDDVELAHYVTPKLTTIRQDVSAKGSIAARLLLDEIEGAPAPADAVVVPVTLVERESSAAIHAAGHRADPPSHVGTAT